MRSRLDLVKNWDRRAQEAGYSASNMARKLGVTLRRLEKFFQERFRSAPHVWMLQGRMQRAARLLMRGNSAKTVTTLIGYKQASHFSREFKRFFGMSPRDFLFRKRRQRGEKAFRAVRV